jgi:hypothetical protein
MVACAGQVAHVSTDTARKLTILSASLKRERRGVIGREGRGLKARRSV